MEGCRAGGGGGSRASHLPLSTGLAVHAVPSHPHPLPAALPHPRLEAARQGLEAELKEMRKAAKEEVNEAKLEQNTAKQVCSPPGVAACLACWWSVWAQPAL